MSESPASPTRPRRTLSLRVATPTERIEQARALIMQAIEQELCLRWSYNRTLMQVAPQILYTGKGELYVDAVALEKNGATPSELKLGRFKLSGLTGVAVTSEPLAPIEAIDLDDVRYQETVLLRIKR